MGGGAIVSASCCAGFRRCDRDRILTLVCKIEVKKEFAPYPELFLQKRLWLYEHFTSYKSHLKTRGTYLCQENTNRRVNKWFVLTHYEENRNHYMKTVFTAYWEFQRRCMECISWQRTERRKKKSRTLEAQWEVGPWGPAARPDKLWVVWDHRYHSSGLVILFLVKRSPQCCWTRGLRQCSTEGSLSSAHNAHRSIRTFLFGYLELCVYSFIYVDFICNNQHEELKLYPK